MHLGPGLVLSPEERDADGITERQAAACEYSG
jgi:hypothetical protein